MRFAFSLLLVLASAPASAQLPILPAGNLTEIAESYKNDLRLAGMLGQVAPQWNKEPVTEPAKPQGIPLADAVKEKADPLQLSHELGCLAGAIYFEAKSESLTGQLAVGRVVVARAIRTLPAELLRRRLPKVAILVRPREFHASDRQGLARLARCRRHCPDRG